MNFIVSYFWVFLILGTLFNGLIIRIKTQKYAKESPDLEKGYKKAIKGWIIFGNIPWIIIGIGELVGLTNGLFDYINPRSSNIIVQIIYLIPFIYWIFGSYWIYFNGGADFLSKHPGIIRLNTPGIDDGSFTPKSIKLIWISTIISGIIGLSILWFWNLGNK